MSNTIPESLLKGLLQGVLEFVEDGFYAKVDKCGVPYYEHCLYVSNQSGKIAENLGLSLQGQYFVKIIGALHDVIEDLDYTEEGLKQELVWICKDNGICATFIEWYLGAIANTVLILSRTEDQSYSDYIEAVKKNKYAALVKSADGFHNSQSDRFKSEDITESIIKRSKKYRAASLELFEVAKASFEENSEQLFLF